MMKGMIFAERYQLEDFIGQGGMSLVYRAVDIRTGHSVAVKILKSEYNSDKEFLERFQREAQAASLMSHHNIVNLLDVGVEGEYRYLVLEYVSGSTLKDVIRQKGRLNTTTAIQITVRILSALQHAHDNGIIHRDIKPQNIMVLRDGSVKVADFGIACLADSAQTLTQEALGSVHYISPEQARGDRPDARSDIYSSGVVFYEMLTGRLPFEGESAVAVAIQHLSSIPLAPREINPDIPEQLELICMKAMAPDLEHRYQSADAMIADLETFRKNPNVEMKFDLSDLRPDESDEPTRPIRTVGGHVAAQPVYQPERSYPRREQEEPEEPRSSGNGKRGVLIGAAAVAAIALVVVLFKTILGSFSAPVTDQYQVPDLYDITIEEAENDPRVKDIFEIQKAGSEFSADVQEGHILRQDPQGGETRKGSQLVIQVWVSAGEETGEMPDLKNQSLQDARILLEKLNKEYNLELTVEAPENQQQYSDEIEADHVISTKPEAGETLKKGDTVMLIISKGPETKPVIVPPFEGMNIDKVLAQIGSYGLTCDAADVELVESDKEGGTIVWQSLEAGTEVDEGSAIQFRVSAGLANSTVPITVDLPQNGSDTVQVEIYVGDEPTPQYSELVHTSDGTVNTTISSTGKKMVKVYFDGVLDQDQSYERSFN